MPVVGVGFERAYGGVVFAQKELEEGLAFFSPGGGEEAGAFE